MLTDILKLLPDIGYNSAIILLAFFVSKITKERIVTKRSISDTYKNLLESFIFLVKYLILIIFVFHIFFLLEDIVNINLPIDFKLVKKISILGLIGFVSIKIINQYEHQILLKKEDKVRIIPIDVLCRILKIVILISLFLIIVETSGINIGGIVAFGSVSGIVIGFASRDLLSNFFGATLLYLDKPFEVGDWILSPDRNIEGNVEAITWRLTKIVSFDKRPIYVPNSIFNSIVIVNASRMSNRRINEVIGIKYNNIDNVKKIVNKIKQMLNSHEEIDNKQTIFVNLTKLNTYSLDITIYAFTKTTQRIKYEEVRQDILLRCCKIIDDHKSQIAFPTTTIEIDNKDNVY